MWLELVTHLWHGKFDDAFLWSIDTRELSKESAHGDAIAYNDLIQTDMMWIEFVIEQPWFPTCPDSHPSHPNPTHYHYHHHHHQSLTHLVSICRDTDTLKIHYSIIHNERRNVYIYENVHFDQMKESPVCRNEYWFIVSEQTRKMCLPGIFSIINIQFTTLFCTMLPSSNSTLLFGRRHEALNGIGETWHLWALIGQLRGLILINLSTVVLCKKYFRCRYMYWFHCRRLWSSRHKG